MLQQFGRERASASPLEGLQIHVQELWSLLHGLWSSDSLEEIVEDLFKGTWLGERSTAKMAEVSGCGMAGGGGERREASSTDD